MQMLALCIFAAVLFSLVVFGAWQWMRAKGAEGMLVEMAAVMNDAAEIFLSQPDASPNQYQVSVALKEQSRLTLEILGKPPLEGLRKGVNYNADAGNHSLPRGAGGHPRGAGAGSIK